MWTLSPVETAIVLSVIVVAVALLAGSVLKGRAMPIISGLMLTPRANKARPSGAKSQIIGAQ